MSARHRFVGAVLGCLLSSWSDAAKLSVRLAAEPQTSYELDVSGIRRRGRLLTGSVRDVVDVGQRSRVVAKVTFRRTHLRPAVCPRIEVAFDAGAASCEPIFVLKSGACSARCEPTASEDEEEETAYAMVLHALYVDPGGRPNILNCP